MAYGETNMKESLVQAVGADQSTMAYTSEVSDIVQDAVGYPPNAPWDKPIGEWLGVLKERLGPICKANVEIFKHFENKDNKSDETLIFEIFADLTPEITEIAISQFEQGYHGPKSWREVNGDASDRLEEKITNALSTDKFSGMLGRSKGIRKALEFVKNVLIHSNDPDYIFRKHSEYIETCVEANANGESILFIPFDSDYTNPVENFGDMTQICEASISVILPIETEERAKFNKLANSLWSRLKQRGNKTDVSIPKFIVGKDMGAAGFSVLSSTVGEVVTFDSGKGNEHCIYLALNNLAKKIEYWNISSDIPAVITAVKMAFENGGYDLHVVITGVLTEYVSEIVTGVSEEAWFEGHRENKSNKIFDGYILSAVLILNSLTDSGLVRMNREGGIDINATPDNLKLFFADLEMVDAKFYEKDKKILERISLAVANPEALELIDLFRTKFKEKLFSQKAFIPTEVTQ
ncbi:MAG: hypothetical protein UU16_C0021G0018 [Candidatus Woesebacteria bacterium GW2011_GWA2_40_7]|uniref:Uncharacterized protein n=1 Tax=Candidatus Woesebacteria bacterium GW2011_GWA2_40_7 TaxID=1618562 RepID=A0A0G0T8Y8_9BACT|nr:MAG: hypothetical protein UU16_C0021G0018 [Candidatus Woesebacteria bacterium GW2011_GWA2_40_7]